MAVQRPIKTYGTRTYVGEVAAAPGSVDPILANEVDADLDTIYAGYNAGPIGAATAGDLAGSAYPNPTIAPNAVTTGKINDGAVTAAKLANGAPLVGFYLATPGPNLVVGTTPVTVLTFPAVVSRGSVIGLGALGATVEIGAGLSGSVVLQWLRGAIEAGYQQFDVSNPTAVILRVPLANAIFYDSAASGTYAYTLKVFTSLAGIFFKIGPVPGKSWVLALA